MREKERTKELYKIREEGRHFSYLEMPEEVISGRRLKISIKALLVAESFKKEEF